MLLIEMNNSNSVNRLWDPLPISCTTILKKSQLNDDCVQPDCSFNLLISLETMLGFSGMSTGSIRGNLFQLVNRKWMECSNFEPHIFCRNLIFKNLRLKKNEKNSGILFPMKRLLHGINRLLQVIHRTSLYHIGDWRCFIGNDTH